MATGQGSGEKRRRGVEFCREFLTRGPLIRYQEYVDETGKIDQWSRVEWGRWALGCLHAKRETTCIRSVRRQNRVLGGSPLYLLNRAASSEPPVTSPAL